MRPRYVRNVALALAALLATAVSASAQTTLRYKFQDGEKLEYVAETKIKMSNNVGGINIGINVDQTINMSWKINKVKSDGSAEVVLKVERMVMSIDALPPIGGVTIDSNDKKESDNILAQQFSKIINKMAGAEINATMSPLGEFSDVKYPKDLEKELEKLAGGLGIGGPGGLEQFTGGGIILPKDAVDKGKTWVHKSEMKIPMGGSATVEMKYTYEGSEGALEKIQVKPKMTIDGVKAGFMLKADETKSKGVILFDNKAGRIAESRIAQVMTATVEMMGLTINMDMDMVSTLKLKGRK